MGKIDMKNVFRVIPAIDLLDGKVVRLLKGAYDRSTVYEVEPTAMLNEFATAGATLIHVVDLNGARSGERGPNLPLLKELGRTASQLGIKLELGGGLRDLDGFRQCLELGFSRGIIGTAAVENRSLIDEILAEFEADQLVVGVDARDGRVRVAGWEEDSGLDALTFINELENSGITEIIYTDIDTDGALSGPPLDALRKILDGSTKLRIIASGGVSSIDDVESLLKINHPRLVGAISGRAIYEKKLDLAAAVRLCDLHTNAPGQI